jgi:hypothetical protein
MALFQKRPFARALKRTCEEYALVGASFLLVYLLPTLTLTACTALSSYIAVWPHSPGSTLWATFGGIAGFVIWNHTNWTFRERLVGEWRFEHSDLEERPNWAGWLWRTVGPAWLGVLLTCAASLVLAAVGYALAHFVAPAVQTAASPEVSDTLHAAKEPRDMFAFWAIGFGAVALQLSRAVYAITLTSIGQSRGWEFTSFGQGALRGAFKAMAEQSQREASMPR